MYIYIFMLLVYVDIHIFININICIYIYIYTYIYVHTHIHICISIHTFIHTHLSFSVCLSFLSLADRERHTHAKTKYRYQDTYIFCVSSAYIYSHVATNMDGSSSAPTCLPVWRADVALCLLLRRSANCRCIVLQPTKPGQRLWQRCCSHTLTLRARLMGYVVGLMWGTVCFARAIVLPSGSDMCVRVCVCVWPVALDGFVQYCPHAYSHRLCAQP